MAAPESLDHFRRGDRERAKYREREVYHQGRNFLSDWKKHQEYSIKSNLFNRPKNINLRRDCALDMNITKSNEEKEYYPESRALYSRSKQSVENIVSRLMRPGCDRKLELDRMRYISNESYNTDMVIIKIISSLGKKRKMDVALSVWNWMHIRGIRRNEFHFNSLVSFCEKMKDWQNSISLMKQMETEGVNINLFTYCSTIGSCEKIGEIQEVLKLFDRMDRDGINRTLIIYNSAISCAEKGLNPGKAIYFFEQMKKTGVKPTVTTYCALISACEKTGQWKLSLKFLEEMKNSGFRTNVAAYSVAISALSKGQQWKKAIDLFREIENSGETPTVVTYNATMTALEKSRQWERALDLFDEMKYKGLPLTVVSYGAAMSACEKGQQWRQCLDFLDEMTELGIRKNVLIFGVAMSCMEKSSRAEIALRLMERMKFEGINPNVHIYNCAIFSCARCNKWEKGYELFLKMGRVKIMKDIVTYNAVLDAVCSNKHLARLLFQEGLNKGFYAIVSRIGTHWVELDLHFLSLGAGEVALWWWFEECIVPLLMNSSNIGVVKTINVVTGHGKTRSRDAICGNDGMAKRIRTMLKFMSVNEDIQPNEGRVSINKEKLITEIKKNDGKIVFDDKGYRKFKEKEKIANAIPDVIQVCRKRKRAMGQ